MRIRTFQGLVPDPARVEEIAAVPYDVVNREEAAALAEGLPHSLLHVDRAEIDLPDSVNPYADEVYQKARANFDKLQAAGALLRETEPALYIYRQVMGDHSQDGLVAVCHIDDYSDDLIRKHEKTRPVKEDDRTRLVDTLSANTGPVFLTYRGTEAIDGLVAAVTATAPRHDFTAPDGIRHVLWPVFGAEANALVEAFGEVPLTYVADGHHRSASAHRVGTERRAASEDGELESDWFLNVLFPADQLSILPYNRVVTDLQNRTPEEFLAALAEVGTIEENGLKEPGRPGSCCFYLDGAWRQLSWDANPDAGPVDSLDVSVLQDKVLAPLLGIDDPRTSNRIHFVGGIRGTGELEKVVDSGEYAIAFSVHPVSLDELMDIADAGEIMAPKCTWFEPKLRSGLAIHTFEGA